MNIKRSVGEEARFIFGEPATQARSKVYQRFYRNLNEELKNKLPKEFQKINKDFTELIPIKNAAIRRQPIQSSNYSISPLMLLSTGLGAGTGYGAGGDLKSAIKGAAAGATLKYLATSPRVAKGAYKAAGKIKGTRVKYPRRIGTYGASKLSDLFSD
jgi:hypothetical protein